MSRYLCPACYGRNIYCRKCKTTHCLCSWNQCPHASAPDRKGRPEPERVTDA